MKQTEVGLIPDDWEVKKLGDIYDFQYGNGNTNPSNNGSFPVYGANGIIGGYTEFNAVDSIVIGHMGEYAGSVIWASGKHFVTYNGTITKPKDERILNSKYGYYSLFFKNINKICAGSGYPFLAYDKLNLIAIPLPPIPEQQRIAKALSDVDALISTIELLIQKKKNIKQGTMQNLLTGKKRLPGFAKSTNYKQSELGLIPEDWEVKKLSDVIQNVKIKQIIKEPLVCGDFPVIQQGSIPIAGYSSGEPFIDYKNAIIFGDHTLSLFKPKKPFFVSSDGLKVLLINKGNPEYFYYLMNMYMPESEGYKRHFSIIKQILIPVTNNILEQTAIANVLSSMDKEIETLNTKLEKYRNLKTAMMQQLLTGKIRLKNNLL